MTAIILIMSASLLVIASSAVVIQYLLVRFTREFNQNMQSQAGRYDCILAMLAELTRIQNDSRILLANMESHLRRITETEPKEKRYDPVSIESTSL